MGIDIEIAVKCKPGYNPPSPSFAVEGEMSDTGNPYVDASTHSLSSLTRYYGEHYERGPWPHIAAYLLELMSDPNVERVWYDGDSGDCLEEMTFERWCKMCDHYRLNGERPYRQKVERVASELAVSGVKQKSGYSNGCR